MSTHLDQSRNIRIYQSSNRERAETSPYPKEATPPAVTPTSESHPPGFLVIDHQALCQARREATGQQVKIIDFIRDSSLGFQCPTSSAFSCTNRSSVSQRTIMGSWKCLGSKVKPPYFTSDLVTLVTTHISAWRPIPDGTCALLPPYAYLQRTYFDSVGEIGKPSPGG